MRVSSIFGALILYAVVFSTWSVPEVIAGSPDVASIEEGLMIGDSDTIVNNEFKGFSSTCTLKVFPEKVYNRRIGHFGMIIVSGIEFEKGDVVDWGTDDIVTIVNIRFPRRIFNIVWIKKDAAPDVYEVTVGDDNCTGTLEIR